MSTFYEKIEMIEKIKANQDFKHLLNAAYKILGNPIFMYDTNYNLMAYTENVITYDRFWNEIISDGTFSLETQKFFKEEGFIDDMANARVVTFMLSDRLKYERISGKIFNVNSIHVANLTMVACRKSFEPDDPAVFEALCSLFSQKISANKYYQDYENTFQEDLIRKLINGCIVDRGLYVAHMAILYGGLKANLFTAVLDFARCNHGPDKLEHFMSLFRSAQPAFKYAKYSNHIVIIMSSSDACIDPKRDMGKLFNILKRKNIFAGISGCFENIYELPAYYNDALTALDYVKRANDRRQICRYDEICGSAKPRGSML